MSKVSKNKKWHHFGKWIETALTMSLWLAFDKTKVYSDLNFKTVTVVKDLDHNYFLMEEEMKRTSQFIEDKFINDRTWFDKLFKFGDKVAVDILSFENKKDLEGFLTTGARCLNTSFAIELVDYGLVKYIEKLSCGGEVKVADVLYQIKPDKKTMIMEYRDELLGLQEENIQDFVKKYEWMGTHMFMNTGLTEEKVKKEMVEVLNSKKEENVSEKLPDIYGGVIKIGSRLAFYRTYLVECFNKAAYVYRPVIESLAGENGLSYDDVLWLTYEEVIKLKKEKKIPNYKERKNGFGIINIDNKEEVIIGEELVEQLEECWEKVAEGIKEIEGMVACKKGGTVKGIVRVIEEAKYISKMEKSDILVANETTPDYVVGMKIAGAIVTNQGGITSHAAITSRELGIPCIIGTKIATQVLKDGDLVEVNADNGIVRKIDE